MAPRILIFVALSGERPTAAVGAACAQAKVGSARPLSLEAGSGDSQVRRLADRLAGNLDLRPVAGQLAVLSTLTTLLRERSEAVAAIAVDGAGELIALLAAADLARARLDAARPPAGVSSLAAHRAGQTPDLAILQAGAAAGDLLRAPEITSVGLLTGPRASAERIEAARTTLGLAGLTVLPGLLPDEAEAAATDLLGRGGAAPSSGDAAARTIATPTGATLQLTLPGRPDDLRAVRSGEELAISSGAVVRRLRAPRSLGVLVPGGVAAGQDGTLIAQFVVPEPAEDPS